MTLAAPLWIAGYPVHSAAPETLAGHLADALERHERTVLLFANANFAVQCAPLRARLRGAGTLIVNDGVAMDLAARLVYGRPFPHNLNGTDFVPLLLARTRRPVWLLGGRPGVARRAALALRAHGQPVAGHGDGYADMADATRLVAGINASGAQIVLVALGNPLQEDWILRHRESLSATLVVGVGALLDFLAGEVPRAPRLVRRLRLEWLYRLAQEPRRLTRRYTVDIVRFLALCTAHGRQAAGPSERA